MAKNTTVKGKHPRASAPARPAVAAPAQAVAAPAEPTKKPKVSPVEFFQQVRQEGRKVTWTSWKETWITSVMVFIMVVLTSVFFLVVDGSLSFLMQQILKLAG
jgi:preprotein translocase subunit SecE